MFIIVATIQEGTFPNRLGLYWDGGVQVVQCWLNFHLENDLKRNGDRPAILGTKEIGRCRTRGKSEVSIMSK